MNKITKEDYDQMGARRDLAEMLLDKLEPLYSAIISARQLELELAPNDTVDTGDFDNLKIKMKDIILAASVLKHDNF